ncbi:hypothetical protein UFOVP629_55 [uncultured Caudovirales phage]|uniref:Uncharacterized protein n=1 Tax=uncultured Caudovirales phage TaxID=2100421 RepID=A0A6J5NFQ5_9CAUD|nr:hypothetical protein UFOVP629_55 [uncultured Caudovirales phage]
MAGLPNPFDKALAPNDAWSRMQYRRYGGRNDDIIAYSMQDQGIMNPSSGFGSSGRAGGSGTNWLGSGSVNTNYGGGNTPSNPGGRNYGTLNNTIGGAANMVNWGFDTRTKLRNNQDKQDRINTLKDARDQKMQSAQKKQNLDTFAGDLIKQSRNLQANNFAKSTKFKPGAASSAPATTINLLDSKSPGGFPASYFKKQTPPQTP